MVPFGSIGGVFSAMFGSGGFIYAMYLSRRLADKDAVRGTQSALLALGTIKEAVVTTRSDAGETRLVAHVVPRTLPAPTARSLRRESDCTSSRGVAKGLCRTACRRTPCRGRRT